jgi:colanic acid/amylovoran biosynthesis glycosyltransferase
MRAAQLVYEFPSVSQTFVRGQLEGLLDLGCDIRIFAEYTDSDAVMPAGLGDRVKYFGFPFRGFRESLGRVRARAKRAQPRADVSGRDSSISKARLLYETRAFRNEQAFDVIHAHFGPNGVRAMRLRDRGLLRGPILTSFYGYDVGKHWTREGYSTLFARGDLFAVLSEDMRRRLVALGCPSERIVVHPLGINVEQFKPRARAAARRLEILSVGRLVPKKGLEVALRAVAQVAARGIPLRYTIVGKGELRVELERLAVQLGISDAVEFAGIRPPGAIVELMQQAHVLLAPSVTAPDGDVEGTPTVILEAQASGVPVVSTIHAGTPEIVDDGKSAFLVPERDVEGLAAKLVDLWQSPSLRAEMGCAGRAIVEGRHDIRVLNRRLEAIYQRLACAQGMTSSTGTSSDASGSVGSGSSLDSASSL